MGKINFYSTGFFRKFWIWLRKLASYLILIYLSIYAINSALFLFLNSYPSNYRLLTWAIKLFSPNSLDTMSFNLNRLSSIQNSFKYLIIWSRCSILNWYLTSCPWKYFYRISSSAYIFYLSSVNFFMTCSRTRYCFWSISFFFSWISLWISVIEHLTSLPS